MSKRACHLDLGSCIEVGHCYIGPARFPNETPPSACDRPDGLLNEHVASKHSTSAILELCVVFRAPHFCGPLATGFLEIRYGMNYSSFHYRTTYPRFRPQKTCSFFLLLVADLPPTLTVFPASAAKYSR